MNLYKQLVRLLGRVISPVARTLPSKAWQLSVTGWQCSRRDVENSLLLTSNCSVQAVAAKWPQSMPKDYPVKWLATIQNTILCVLGLPNPEFTKQ
jgi:hypothetical protein